MRKTLEVFQRSEVVRVDGQLGDEGRYAGEVSVQDYVFKDKLLLFDDSIAKEEEIVDDGGAGGAEDGDSGFKDGEDGRVSVEGRIVEFDEIAWDADAGAAQGEVVAGADVVEDFIDGSC